VWLRQAVVDSLLLYFVCVYAYRWPTTLWAGDGHGSGLFVFGLTVYTTMFLAMSESLAASPGGLVKCEGDSSCSVVPCRAVYKVGVMTYTWTWVTWFFYLGR
jgi:hypothetical protein